ncbi:hypothetical protein Tco_1181144 [Tanacetum coccineum]
MKHSTSNLYNLLKYHMQSFLFEIKDEYEVWAMKNGILDHKPDMNIWKNYLASDSIPLMIIMWIDFQYMDDARDYGMQSKLDSPSYTSSTYKCSIKNSKTGVSADLFEQKAGRKIDFDKKESASSIREGQMLHVSSKEGQLCQRMRAKVDMISRDIPHSDQEIGKDGRRFPRP